MLKFRRKSVDRALNYQAIFNTEAGHKVLYDLIKTHHILSSTFVKGDPNETALREGERNVVLRIMSILEIDPDELAKRIEEAHQQNLQYKE